MADEGGIDTAIAVELFFKWKNYQRFIDVIPQQPHASLSPGPELRRYVVDHRNSTLLHLSSHAPVKGGRVDDDGEVGLAFVGFGNQMLVEAQDLRQMANDFGDADDGEIFRVDHGVTAGGPHALAADAEEFKRGLCGDSRPRLSSGAKLLSLSLSSPVESFDELRAVHFPGSFAS